MESEISLSKATGLPPPSSGLALMADDTRDRLIRLEMRMEHVEEKIDAAHSAHLLTSARVAEMHDLLMQAKGMKYIVVGMAMVGGFIAAKLGAIVAFFRA
jgi:hypothetical protein